VWVVIVDSLGYEAGANRLFSTVGFGIDPITAAYLDRRDMKRAYDAVHFIRPDIKTEQIRLKAKMIKDGLRQLEEDGHEGAGYSPSEDVAVVIQEAGGVVAHATGPVICPLCQLTGHKTKRSHYCWLNANNVAARAAVAAAEAAANAANVEAAVIREE